MLSRRALLGGLAAGCVRSGLEDADVPLQKQIIPVKLTGLAGNVDPKAGLAGRLETVENAYAIRSTDDGGIELRKRPGLTAQGRSIFGGGSISTGRRAGTFGEEAVMTDGSYLYGLGWTANDWHRRGKLPDVDTQMQNIATTSGDNTTAYPVDVDVGYCNGYLLVAYAGFSAGTVYWRVVETTGGTTVTSGSFGGGTAEYTARITVVGSDFYIFSHDAGNTIKCRKLPTSTLVLSAASNVATDVTIDVWDVIADTTNSRMVVGYGNTAGTSRVTLMIWNTNMTAGASVVYASRIPSAVGFLVHDFADGNGYLAITDTTTGTRCLTFGSSSMTVTVDTQIEAAATDATGLTGYFSTVRNVFYTRPGAAPAEWNNLIKGWNGTTLYTVMRSVQTISRPFKVGTRWHMHVLYQETNTGSALQNNLYLLELEQDTTGGSGAVMVAGHLLAGNAGPRTTTNPWVVPAVAQVSSTVFVGVWARVLTIPGPTAQFESDASAKFGITLFTHTFAASGLGKPVRFADLLYLPGSAAMTYDGKDVVENGFFVYPRPPSLAAGAGGSLTADSTYQAVVVYARHDNATGNIIRSAPSTVASLAIAGANRTITLTAATCRVTNAAATYNLNSNVTPVTIEVYMSRGNTSDLHLVATLANDVTADTVNVAVDLADSTIIANPLLYTTTSGGATASVDHIYPPCVRAFEAHRGRLFALTGEPNGGLWFTKEIEEGEGAAFSDSLRVQLSTSGGLPTGLVSLEGTLVVSYRDKMIALSGDGPNKDGSNPYAYPTALPADVGFSSARAFAMTPEGPIFQSPKGFAQLDRGGSVRPLPGADAYESLTVTGGVTLDDRPFACLTTSDGRTLAWDWELKTWYTWTNHAAVAATRWQNKLALLASDGTLKYENAGSYTDPSATSITMKVVIAWLSLAGLFGRLKLYGVHILAEFLASFNLSATLAYDNDASDTEAPAAFACTTATKRPLVIPPARRRVRAVQVTLQETSTTEGFRLSALGLEVGVEAGAIKVPNAQQLG